MADHITEYNRIEDSFIGCNNEITNFNEFGDTLKKEMKQKENLEKNIPINKIVCSSGIISYYFTSILTLLKYNKYHQLCKQSNIWYYLLFSLTLNFGLVIDSKYIIDKYNITNFHITYLVIIIYKILFMIWYVIETISTPCLDELKDTSLVTLSMIQFFVDNITIIFYVFKLYKFNIKNELENEETSIEFDMNNLNRGDINDTQQLNRNNIYDKPQLNRNNMYDTPQLNRSNMYNTQHLDGDLPMEV